MSRSKQICSFLREKHKFISENCIDARPLIEYNTQFFQKQALEEGLHPSFRNFLLKNGVNLEIFDADDKKCLFHQLMLHVGQYNYSNEDLHFAKMCLEKGVDIDSFGKHGYTALQRALIEKNEKAIAFLIENGANINEPNIKGRTILHCAQIENYEYSSGDDVLNEPSFDKIHKNPDIKNTVEAGLQFSRFKSKREAMAYFIQKGADINALNNKGNAIILHAVIDSKNDPEDFVEFLLNNGANPNFPDSQGLMPLHWSLYKNLPLSNLLIENDKTDIHAITHSGSTPLHFACRHGNKSAVMLLLNKEADPYVENKRGYTPFTEAIKEGHIDVVRIFIERGYCFEQENKERKTPVSIAKSFKRNDVVEFLEKTMKDRESQNNFANRVRESQKSKSKCILP